MDNRETFEQKDQYEVLSDVGLQHLFDFSWNSTTDLGDTICSTDWVMAGDIAKNKNLNVGVVIDDSNPYRPNRGKSSVVSSDIDNGGLRLLPHFEENLAAVVSPKAPDFRYGYVEMSFKTDKNNSTLAYGSNNFDFTLGSAGSFSSPATDSTLTNVADENEAGEIVSGKYKTSSFLDDLGETRIKVSNGRICVSYTDYSNTSNNSYEVCGVQNVSDFQWHHLVVNFTRDDNVEIWIDGVLDYTQPVNNNVFKPAVSFIGLDMNEFFSNAVELNTVYADSVNFADRYISFDEETLLSFGNGSWPEKATATAFSGFVRTYAFANETPITNQEVQERYKFWSYNESAFRPSMTATATIPEPVVSGNKPKVLKLFWPDLPIVNGVELDNSYVVETYAVTHQNKRSATETYNIDLANANPRNILENVKVAIGSNVLISSPAAVYMGEKSRSPFDLSNVLVTTIYDGPAFSSQIENVKFGGAYLSNGDRVLLTNQFNQTENGIWVYNGPTNSMSRPSDADSASDIANSIVLVTEGYEAGTYWQLDKDIESMSEIQTWVKTENPDESGANDKPIFTGTWTRQNGTARYINLQQDLDMSKYSFVVFMNYPTSYDQVDKNLKEELIDSLKQYVIGGGKLHISSPLLAASLGIIDEYHEVSQEAESSDAQSAVITPFEYSEVGENYFDTHRNNRYQLATPVPGLTDKPTYLMTNFISYNDYTNPRYHIKYVNRPLGIQEGDEFIIPGLALLGITDNSRLPGNRENYRGTKPLIGAHNVVSGTVVTTLANTYYDGDVVVNNQHDDDVNTIVLQPGDTIDGTPIAGKVFANFVEDGYPLSRVDYNKATIQVLPQDTNETINMQQWQYSTTRLDSTILNREIKVLTEYGQTVPTLGGGGPIVQVPSASSFGVIRVDSDTGNDDFESDIYPTVDEEVYEIQEIPVLSMTMLGLQWLAE